MRRLPLSLVFSVIALAYLAGGAALTLWLSDYFANRWLALAVVVAVLAPLLIYHVRRAFAPMNSLFRALAGSVASYRDGDYSISFNWTGGGDLGELVASHNRLGDALREQRLSLVQRELLLDTMIQNTPVAMMLVDPTRRIVHGNLASRSDLNERASSSSSPTPSRRRPSFTSWRAATFPKTILPAPSTSIIATGVF